jgi:hypothetical protein
MRALGVQWVCMYIGNNAITDCIEWQATSPADLAVRGKLLVD